MVTVKFVNSSANNEFNVSADTFEDACVIAVQELGYYMVIDESRSKNDKQAEFEFDSKST